MTICQRATSHETSFWRWREGHGTEELGFGGKHLYLLDLTFHVLASRLYTHPGVCL